MPALRVSHRSSARKPCRVRSLAAPLCSPVNSSVRASSGRTLVPVPHRGRRTRMWLIVVGNGVGDRRRALSPRRFAGASWGRPQLSSRTPEHRRVQGHAQGTGLRRAPRCRPTHQRQRGTVPAGRQERTRRLLQVLPQILLLCQTKTYRSRRTRMRVRGTTTRNLGRRVNREIRKLRLAVGLSCSRR